MVSDEILVRRLKAPATREQAFRELVSQYKERLYWHIRRTVIDHEDTDDVLQNTFIKIYRNIDKFKEESSLFSWMYRIAINESITFLNAKAKRKGLDNGELQESLVANLHADTYFSGDDVQLKLQQAIATLPEKQKLVFNMKYFEGITYEEMSGILDTSVGALKASYHHAVKKIEHFLTGD
ncbi:RNA polymerase sigma-70 factor, ECF subfamily [Sinomicrobium oceani]|uniref:RNA polymerase sigma-70 factor, ECF subfamily n=1 Tax=Sinomicrobium oceani TaxID=1150368 RepID=A0A1K1MWI0_9FLAO|nr:RNA polymerase sigma factor [Sinomicrobium oceani]SFW26342.1 RNA polymerase sigma-70 factor, ECF subfamily [Sinomicrobium oceani]